MEPALEWDWARAHCQTAFSWTAWEGNLGPEGNRSQRDGDRMMKRQITGLDDGRVKEVLDQLEAQMTEDAKTCIEWTHAKRKPRPLAAATNHDQSAVHNRHKQRVLGQTCAGFSSPRTRANAGKYVNMYFPFTTKLWAYASRIKASTMMCGSTWISLIITVTMNGFSSKKGPAPYQHSKQRCKTGEDENDRSLSS